MRGHARNGSATPTGGPGLYVVLVAMLFAHSVASYLIHH